MRMLVASILIFSFGHVTAQQINYKTVRVFDEISKESLPNVHFRFLGTVYSSNRSGIARVTVSAGDSLYISHIAYRDTAIFLKPNNQSIEIALRRLSNDLSEVTVSNKPLEIFAPEKSHVFDFQFIGDTLLALTYKKEIMFRKAGEQAQELYAGCDLVVVSPSGNILIKQPLPDRIQGFYQDGLGQIFLIGPDLNWFVRLKSGEIFKEAISKEKFENQIMPLKAATSVGYVCDDYNWQYPEFSYYLKAGDTDQYELFRTIRDDYTMELFRAQYKYMSGYDKLRAIRLEANTGVDKEIYAAYMTGFQHNIYYKKPYAPIFCQSDTLLIFDHHRKFIYLHSPTGETLDSIPIGYLNIAGNLKFADKVLKDASTGLYYACFRKNGRNSVKRILLASGKPAELIELFHPYPEKIQLRNGMAYYLYRSTHGENTKHLFAERL